MGAGTSTFHQFDAEELAKYAAEHLKEDGEAVAAIIRREEVDGDLALSLRDMGEEALGEFAKDSADDQAMLQRALEELGKAVQEDAAQEHHGPSKDEEARLVKQARMQALKYKRKHPNELHIHLIKARNLLVMDEAMLVGKGSSDPYVKFACFGENKKSQVIKKSLDPEWDEKIVLDIDDPKQFVEVEVWDYDMVGADDFMGRVVLPLAPYSDKQRHRAWFPLLNKKGGVDKDKKTGKDKPRGDIELAVTWAYEPERAKRIEMDLQTEIVAERQWEKKALAEAQAQLAKEHEEHKEAKRKALLLTRQKQKYEDAKQLFHESQEQQKEEDTTAAEGKDASSDEDDDDDEDGADDDAAAVAAWGGAVGKASADETATQRRARWDALVASAIEDVARDEYEAIMDNEDHWENVAPEGAEPDFKPPSFESWWKHNKETFAVPSSKAATMPLPFEEWNARETAKFVFPSFDEWVALNDDMSLDDESMLSSLGGHKSSNDEEKDDEGEAKGDESKTEEKKDGDSDGDSDGEDEDAKQARLLAPNELCIALVRARGLQAVDMSLLGAASSDPMVTFECDGEIAKSRCIKKDLNPIWRERFELPLHSYSDGFFLPMVATVDDVDQIGANDFMGQTVQIDVAKLTKEWTGPSWYVLGDKDHSHDALDDTVDKTGGKDDGPLKKAKLWLTIFGARDLLAADSNGFSDPYATAELIDKESGKPLKVPRTTKTKSIKKTLNPEWNEGEVQWSDITEDVETVALCVKIFDADMMSSEALGSATIALADLVTENSTSEETSYPLVKFGKMKKDATGEVRLLARVVVTEELSAAAKKRDAATAAKAKLAPESPSREAAAKAEKGGGEANPEAAQQAHHESHADHAALYARGAVEMALRVRHNPALVEPPLVPELVVPSIDNNMSKGIDDLQPEPIECADKMPNELKITLWRGRHLRIMDANWFSKGGSSDPLVKFVIGQESCKSTTKKKSLDPVWGGESWSLKADSPDGVLVVIMEDYDALSGNDFMGKVTVPLRKLADRKPCRHWYKMTDKHGKRGGKSRGDIDLQLRWVFNPDYEEKEVELTPEEALKPEKGELKHNRHLVRNELMVTLVRAKNLAVMDKNLFSSGGSSDPLVTFNIKGGGFPEGNGEGSWLGNVVSSKYRHVTKCKSSVKKKNLSPVWKETFVMACGNEDGQKVRVEGEKEKPSDDGAKAASGKQLSESQKRQQKQIHHREKKKYHYKWNLSPEHAALDVVVDDYDLVGANDFMGRVRIPLAPLAKGAPHRAWYVLGDEKTGRPDGVTQRGQIELVLRWKHNPDTPEAVEIRRLAEEAARRAAEEAARDPLVVERAALDDLYTSTGGVHWTHGHEWHSHHTPVGERYGVTTDEEGRVVEIEIHRNNLCGPLPASLGKIKRLRLLSLPDNDLTGPIPPEFGNLESLIVISLRGNRLSGEIPEELGNLSRLTCVALSDNELSGPLPRTFFDLTRLVELRLFNNRLSGELPDDPDLWASWKQLKYLGLTGNQFSGRIPGRGLKALQRRLNYVDLGDNRFSGRIPDELGDCLQLTYLSVSHNQLSGKVPPSLGHLTRLQYVDLTKNNLDIPPEFTDEMLNISCNPGILYDEIRLLFERLGLDF